MEKHSNKTKAQTATKGPGSLAAISSQTLYSIEISNYKQFDITITCSSSSGFNYDVKTSPIDSAMMYSSQTGGHFAEGVCSTRRHSFIDNNMAWLIITGSATATVSASHVSVVLTSIGD